MNPMPGTPASQVPLSGRTGRTGRTGRRPRAAWEYLAFAAVGLLILVGAGWAGGTVWRDWHYGTIVYEAEAAAAGTEPVASVEPGERVTVAIPDRGASVGDSWSPGVQPEGALRLVDDGLVMGNVWDRVFGPAPGGGGGHHYFIFEAVRSGDSTVTLTNCFQGRCGAEEPESRSVTWQIVVLRD